MGNTWSCKHKQDQVLPFIITKNTFSVALLAIRDARYKFTLVDIGDSVRQSDGSVYNCSHLDYAFENNLLQIPGIYYKCKAAQLRKTTSICICCRRYIWTQNTYDEALPITKYAT